MIDQHSEPTLPSRQTQELSVPYDPTPPKVDYLLKVLDEGQSAIGHHNKKSIERALGMYLGGIRGSGTQDWSFQNLHARGLELTQAKKIALTTDTLQALLELAQNNDPEISDDRSSEG